MFRYIQVKTSSGALYTIRDHSFGGGNAYLTSRLSSAGDVRNEVVEPFTIQRGERMHVFFRDGLWRFTTPIQSIKVTTYGTNYSFTDEREFIGIGLG